MLLLEREKPKIKKVQWKMLIVERDELNQKNAQLMIRPCHLFGRGFL